MQKFMIVGFEYDPAYELFREVFEDEDIVFVRNPLKTSAGLMAKVLKKMLKCSLVPTFLLPFVFSKLLCFERNEDLTIIYTIPWIEILVKSGGLRFLKQYYPNAHHAAYLLDVHASRCLDLESVKRNYDLVAMFSEDEAKLLGVDYLPPMCSDKTSFGTSQDEIYDLSFTGQAKGRYSELIKVYKRLTANGLTCHFYIIGVPEVEQYHAEGLVYGDELLSPGESFSYLITSRCLLEIPSQGTCALSVRVQDAVVHGKKLLSNNPAITDFKYYRPDLIQVYSDVNDIDLSFFREQHGAYAYEGDYSPRTFLKTIAERCRNAKHIN